MNAHTIPPRLNKPAANDPVDDAISVYGYKALNAVAEWVANTVGAVRAWRTRHAAIAELSQLDDRLLNDIGIDRNEIRAVVNGMLSRPSARAHCPAPALHVVFAPDPARSAADNENESADVA